MEGSDADDGTCSYQIKVVDETPAAAIKKSINSPKSKLQSPIKFVEHALGEQVEEGEIVDEFEAIISSDDELEIELQTKKRIEELEAENDELEKIAKISGSYDLGYQPYLEKHRSPLTSIDIISDTENKHHHFHHKKQYFRKEPYSKSSSKHSVAPYRQVDSAATSFNQSKRLRKKYHSKRRHCSRQSRKRHHHRHHRVKTRKKHSESPDLVILSPSPSPKRRRSYSSSSLSLSSEEDENFSTLNRDSLRLALNGNVYKRRGNLKNSVLRMEKENEKLIIDDPNGIVKTTVETTKQESDDSVTLEEQELRLLALKSAVVKKHLKRKKRKENEKPYSPSDFESLIQNNPSPKMPETMEDSPVASPIDDDEQILLSEDMDLANSEESNQNLVFVGGINHQFEQEIKSIENEPTCEDDEGSKILFLSTNQSSEVSIDDEEEFALRAFLLAQKKSSNIGSRRIKSRKFSLKTENSVIPCNSPVEEQIIEPLSLTESDLNDAELRLMILNNMKSARKRTQSVLKEAVKRLKGEKLKNLANMEIFSDEKSHLMIDDISHNSDEIDYANENKIFGLKYKENDNLALPHLDNTVLNQLQEVQNIFPSQEISERLMPSPELLYGSSTQPSTQFHYNNSFMPSIIQSNVEQNFIINQQNVPLPQMFNENISCPINNFSLYFNNQIMNQPNKPFNSVDRPALRVVPIIQLLDSEKEEINDKLEASIQEQNISIKVQERNCKPDDVNSNLNSTTSNFSEENKCDEKNNQNLNENDSKTDKESTCNDEQSKKILIENDNKLETNPENLAERSLNINKNSTSTLPKTVENSASSSDQKRQQQNNILKKIETLQNLAKSIQATDDINNSLKKSLAQKFPAIVEKMSSATNQKNSLITSKQIIRSTQNKIIINNKINKTLINNFSGASATLKRKAITQQSCVGDTGARKQMKSTVEEKSTVMLDIPKVNKLIISLNNNSSSSDYDDDEEDQINGVLNESLSYSYDDNASPISFQMYDNSPCYSPQPTTTLALAKSDSNSRIPEIDKKKISQENTTSVSKNIVNDLFQAKLDEFLKNARTKVDKAKETVDRKELQMNQISLTPLAVRHLPKSSQEEYRRLVSRMKMLEKQRKNKHTNVDDETNSLKLLSPMKNFKVTIKNDNAIEENLLENPNKTKLLIQKTIINDGVTSKRADEHIEKMEELENFSTKIETVDAIENEVKDLCDNSSNISQESENSKKRLNSDLTENTQLVSITNKFQNNILCNKNEENLSTNSITDNKNSTPQVDEIAKKNQNELLQRYEQVYIKTGCNIMTSINNALDLVKLGQREKMQKMKLVEQVEKLQKHLNKYKNDLEAQSEKVKEIYSSIADSHKMIFEMKNRRTKLDKATKNLGKSLNGEDYKLDESKKPEILSKYKELSNEIKALKSLKYFHGKKIVENPNKSILTCSDIDIDFKKSLSVMKQLEDNQKSHNLSKTNEKIVQISDNTVISKIDTTNQNIFPNSINNVACTITSKSTDDNEFKSSDTNCNNDDFTVDNCSPVNKNQSEVVLKILADPNNLLNKTQCESSNNLKSDFDLVKIDKGHSKLGNEIDTEKYEDNLQTGNRIIKENSEHNQNLLKIEYLSDTNVILDQVSVKSDSHHKNSYKSPLDYGKREIPINPRGILCPFQLKGQCDDIQCKFEHLKL